MYVKLIPLVYPNKVKIFSDALYLSANCSEELLVLDREGIQHVFPLSDWRFIVSLMGEAAE